MGVTTTVMQTGPAHFNQVGQFQYYPLTDTTESISAGLTQRLLKYAARRFADAGLAAAIAETQAEVYTTDADLRPSQRQYGVKFRHPQGGYVELTCILTRAGWPVLDHGFQIGEE